MNTTAVSLFFRCLMLAALCWILTPGPPPALAQETIRWQPYDAGIPSAKADKKKLIVHFYADWCSYCKKMEAETFRNKDVIQALNDRFVTVRVDTDRQKQIAAQFRVRGLPDTWFVGEDGVPIGNRAGFMSADQLLKILRSLP